MLNRFLARLNGVIALHKAYNLCAARRYQDSLDVIQSTPNWRETKQLRLFAILQLSLLKKHDEVLKESAPLIESLEASSRTPNNLYLVSFAKWHRAMSADASYPLDWKPPYLEPDVSFSLRHVSPTLRRTFPLPIHPEWSARAES